MSARANQKLIAAAAVRHESCKIALRAGREEQRALETKALGRYRLQTIDARIIAEHIVAHFRGRHGGAHPGSGPSHGIAAQVDG